ncbi:MAG: ribonuclease III [Lachnospiraceae bacterium]|nr:ribonuclease III [Lachnospiraceae bacterium]
MEQSIKYMKEQLGIGDVDIRTYSPLALAYIGDCVFDMLIRHMIVSKGNMAVQKYHKKVSSLVNAHAQAEMITGLEPELSEEEQNIYKRGRNSKPATTAKNASVKEYKMATGMEALLGYLYLTDQHTRLIDLVKRSIEIWEENHKTGC